VYAISRWIPQGNSVKFCANVGQIATETLEIIRQASGDKARVIHGKSELTDTKKGEKGTGKLRTSSTFYVSSRVLFMKNEVEVEINLRPTVNRPVCLGVRRPSGTFDQFLFSSKFPSDSCVFVIL
jgi:hypothetical protein